MSQLKFSLKIWNNISIGGRVEPLGPPPGHALVYESENRSKSAQSY